MAYIRPLEIILVKKTTELVLLLHKKTTKLAFLQKVLQMLRALPVIELDNVISVKYTNIIHILCLQYCSHAYYKTDEEGRVDLDTATSSGGCYQGVFPAGLFTTFKPAPGQFQFHRLVAKDPSIPWKV